MRRWVGLTWKRRWRSFKRCCAGALSLGDDASGVFADYSPNLSLSQRLIDAQRVMGNMSYAELMYWCVRWVKGG
jgi:hypothetical protein